MVCALAQTVDPWSSCHTVRVDPDTASASREVPGPEASTDVWAGVGGSSSHCCPGPPMVAACPPGSSTHVPSGDAVVAAARPPDAVTALATGSAGDAVQCSAGSAHSAVSPSWACTSAVPGPSRTSGPEAGSVTRCQPSPAE